MKIRLIPTILSASVLVACTEEEPTTSEAMACFDYTPSTEIMVGDEVSFSNCSENAIEYAWDFGDGEVSSQDNPSHIFESAGEFTVTLTASNENGTNDVSKTVTVMNDPIMANRWKSEEQWSDYCDVETQTIQGYEFLSFNADKSVLYELELTGETYGCDGDSDPAGTWEKINTNQYIHTDEDGDEAEIEIIDGGNQIKYTEDDGEVSFWNKE